MMLALLFAKVDADSAAPNDESLVPHLLSCTELLHTCILTKAVVPWARLEVCCHDHAETCCVSMEVSDIAS